MRQRCLESRVRHGFSFEDSSGDRRKLTGRRRSLGAGIELQAALKQLTFYCKGRRIEES